MGADQRLKTTARTAAGVLTIAGSDSGAGAGVQADARTIQALGGFAFTAITAVTAQNSLGIVAWKPVASSLISSQVAAVLADLPVRAVKTGLLPGPAAIRAIAEVLARHPRLPLVIDPVMGSTSGTPFLTEAGLRALKASLFPLATLVTPNWPEAAALSGRPVRNRREVEKAAVALLRAGANAVLIKGGHAPGPVCPDFLATADGKTAWLKGRRIASGNTHGTGCVLSAAIALGLAQGRTVAASVAEGRRFLRQALQSGRRSKWGKGKGPAFSG